MKPRRLSGKFFGWFARTVAFSRTPFALLMAILAGTITYRILLTLGLFTNPIRPFDFSPGSHPFRFILAFGNYDVAMALACFLLFGGLYAGRVFVRGRIFPVLQGLGLFLVHLVLFGLLFAHLGHLRVLFDAQTGLDYSVILETIYNVSTRDILKFLEIRDYFFLLLPFGIFWLVLLSPVAVRIWAAAAALAGVVLLSSLSLWAGRQANPETPREIRLNPVLFLLADTARSTFLGRPDRAPGPGRVQGIESGMQLTGPEFSLSMKTPKILPPRPERRWNVVFLVLESVGTRYMFDGRDGYPMPMPFLHRLSREGWHWKQHYTTSNVSTKAVFSLFSGLYDLFKRETLGTRPDARVPSLYTFLPGYDSFLVSPSSSSWYFPASFIRNSGIPEIHTYENLNFKVREESNSLGRYIARDEIQTVDFFTRRLTRAREPFLALYVSFAAHFPYFDNGPEYRVRPDDGRLISRYYNNLNLLDHMVKRIYEHLRREGLLERTLLVIVGDHGQAFGQHHPDNYLHYRYSYNENLEAPAIFHQPAIFKPRVFEEPTQHVDVLPTLLDALRVPYDPALFDGESLFQKTLKRKYLYFYGLEESISSLDAGGVKVQYSVKQNRGRAFNLKQDRDENRPLDCSPYEAQLAALRTFVSFHDSSLVRYNESAKEGSDFRGRRHPSAGIMAQRGP